MTPRQPRSPTYIGLVRQGCLTYHFIAGISRPSLRSRVGGQASASPPFRQRDEFFVCSVALYGRNSIAQTFMSGNNGK
ncbi:MAG: hypothetical protein AB1393_08070 [Candidatus Edwardsbacteria bacterium]